MSDIKPIYQKQRRILFFLLSFYVLGWGFTTYETIFLGLIFGTSLGLFNMWLLARRVDKFGDKVLKGEKVRSLGMMTRMASGILAVMIALEYPDYLHLYSVILGLMTPYFVIMIEFFKQAVHSDK